MGAIDCAARGGRQITLRQVKVATRANHLIRGHIGILHAVIGDNHAHKAPFLAQHVGQQGVAAARPHVADAVEGGHDALRIRLLDDDFNRLQIDFAHCLLICPRHQPVCVAVRLLVIEH